MPGRTDPFDDVAARLDYPMYVVTAAAGEERSGCLVGFGTQCSIDPPRYLVCVSRANRTFEVALRAEQLVVHFLGEGDGDLARLFGEETGDEVDKFAQCDWHPGPDGVTPVLDGCAMWLAGPVVDRFDAGDHVALVVEAAASEAGAGDGWRPLGFQAVKDLEPGHPP